AKSLGGTSASKTKPPRNETAAKPEATARKPAGPRSDAAVKMRRAPDKATRRAAAEQLREASPTARRRRKSAPEAESTPAAPTVESDPGETSTSEREEAE
ncbi:MAG: hypothetical protein ACRYG8_40880, partial [Janthinobacterium lividum]